MSGKAVTRRQGIWLAVIVAAIISAVVVGYFVLRANDKPAPVVPKPNVPTPKSPQPDSTLVDNRRRTAANATLTMLQSYASENAGTYPQTATELRQAVDTYGKMIASSTTIVYKASYDPAETPSPTDMFYYLGYRCSANEPVTSTSRSVAVRYVVSSGAYECVDNS